MDYVSAKELATIWGITSKRVIVMAKNNQIPGAKLIGNSWVFPANTTKPKDKRYKNNKNITSGIFRFPILSLKNWDKDLLSNEELKLLSIEKKCFSLNYEESYQELKELLKNTSNPTIKVACLFYLCQACGMNGRYQEAVFHYSMLKSMLSSDIPHKNELMLLLYDIDSYMIDNSGYINLDINPANYDPSCAPELCLSYCYKALLEFVSNKTTPDIKTVELFMLVFDEENYPLTNTYLHIYLSLFYSLFQKFEQKIYHAKKALELSYKYHYDFAIVMFYNFLASSIPYIEDSFDKEYLKIIKEENEIYLAGLKGVKDAAANKNSPLLSVEEYEYLGYLAKGLRDYEIAEIKGISEKMVFLKYQKIREKFEAKNKKELLEKYNSFLITYSI